MTAAEILVIFLSVALALFLLLAIILTAYLIVIARKIKRVAETAERTVEHFDGVAAAIRGAIAPAMVTKVVADIVSRFSRRNKSKEED